MQIECANGLHVYLQLDLGIVQLEVRLLQVLLQVVALTGDLLQLHGQLLLVVLTSRCSCIGSALTQCFDCLLLHLQYPLRLLLVFVEFVFVLLQIVLGQAQLFTCFLLLAPFVGYLPLQLADLLLQIILFILQPVEFG